MMTPPRALVVDDNQVNVRVAKAMLERLGYAVDSAVNGQEALNATEIIEYAVVLMDCMMPVMDGFTATTRIRQRESSMRRLPIIAVSASLDAYGRGQCLAAGMDGFIVKPVRFQTLKRVIAEVLDGGSSHAGRLNVVSSAAVLDRDVQAALADPHDGLGWEQLEALMALYLRSARADIEALEIGLHMHDPMHALTAIHSLRGSSGSVGALVVQATCAGVEPRAAEGDLSGMADLPERLRVQVDEVIEAFAEYRAARRLSTMVADAS